MKSLLTTILLFSSLFALRATDVTLTSPDGRTGIHLKSRSASGQTTWYLELKKTNATASVTDLPEITLGIVRNDQAYSIQMQLVKTTAVRTVHEDYTDLHGKKSHCVNEASERILTFQNPDKSILEVHLRAYNDGIAFRYAFPGKNAVYTVTDELTAYRIPSSAERWLEKWNPANENLYTPMKDGKQQQDWCYPALFRSSNPDTWYLLHEANLDRGYCGSKLSNKQQDSIYKITFPDPGDGRGTGQSQPVISLPWQSPWRILIIGSLQDIVSSTLTNDVSAPSKIKNTDWIRPGAASWNYWSDNHGTRDFKTVCKFADLAAEMNWPYTLLDWEWDAMGNGGKLEDAVSYIRSLGVTPLIWYNSGGNHTWVNATPKDRFLTHESRIAEMTKLKKMGIAGVKIDFFESEKQDMIKYYLDILDDALACKMMIYFHGCLVPRGWQRTYPNLMTYEGVRGAEWYNNTPAFTATAPEHNTILPFTRNVVGSMDYTPVTFTNSQFPHITSYGHELALSVVFESGIQHFADRPEGYRSLPQAAIRFLSSVPNNWDDTRLIDGYPGKNITLARRKGNNWYLGGINAENMEKKTTLRFDFLPENTTYKLTLIGDGDHDKSFFTSYQTVDKNSLVNLKMLRRGGFAALLEPQTTPIQ